MMGGDDFANTGAQVANRAGGISGNLERVADQLDKLIVSRQSRPVTRTGASRAARELTPEPDYFSSRSPSPQTDRAQNPVASISRGESTSSRLTEPKPKLIAGDYAYNKKNFPKAYQAAKSKSNPGVVVGKPPQGVKGDIVTTTKNGYKDEYFGLPMYNTAIRTPEKTNIGKHAHRQ